MNACCQSCQCGQYCPCCGAYIYPKLKPRPAPWVPFPWQPVRYVPVPVEPSPIRKIDLTFRM